MGLIGAQPHGGTRRRWRWRWGLSLCCVGDSPWNGDSCYRTSLRAGGGAPSGTVSPSALPRGEYETQVGTPGVLQALSGDTGASFGGSRRARRERTPLQGRAEGRGPQPCPRPPEYRAGAPHSPTRSGELQGPASCCRTRALILTVQVPGLFRMNEFSERPCHFQGNLRSGRPHRWGQERPCDGPSGASVASPVVVPPPVCQRGPYCDP